MRQHTGFGIAVIAFMASATSMVGCASSGNKNNSATAGSEVTVSFTYEPTGLPKYDEFLARSQQLISSLDQAQAALNGLAPALRNAGNAILAAVGETKKLSDQMSKPAEIMKAIADGVHSKASLEVVVTVTADQVSLSLSGEAGASVATPEALTKAREALDATNTLLAKIKAVPQSLAAVATDAQGLVSQGTELVTSAKSDFKGLAARKLPGCTASMNKAIDILKTAPDHSKAVVAAATTAIADISAMAK